MSSSAADRRAGIAIAALLALAAPTAAQRAPELRAAFGARASRLLVPAVEWLCGTCLPARPEWPRDLDRDGPFAIVLSARGLSITATNVSMPAGIVALGSCSIGNDRPTVFCCSVDGTEDWFVPRDFDAPAPWRALLADLGADVLDAPRTLDAAVVIGHLAGALVDGDPRAEVLRLGSSSCAQVAWTAWTTATHVRVRGRSDGGLTLPATLLLLATGAEPASATSLALRAFAARDGDRAEAARQFARVQDPRSVAALRALLHAEDTVALAAIDALVRLRAAEELPNIVAAAKAQAPWASLAAADAVRELWIDAGPSARARTRTALARSDDLVLRSIDPDRLPTRAVGPLVEPAATDGAGRARALLMLGVFAIALHGLWSRERARLRAAGLR